LRTARIERQPLALVRESSFCACLESSIRLLLSDRYPASALPPRGVSRATRTRAVSPDPGAIDSDLPVRCARRCAVGADAACNLHAVLVDVHQRAERVGKDYVPAQIDPGQLVPVVIAGGVDRATGPAEARTEEGARVGRLSACVIRLEIICSDASDREAVVAVARGNSGVAAGLGVIDRRRRTRTIRWLAWKPLKLVRRREKTRGSLQPLQPPYSLAPPVRLARLPAPETPGYLGGLWRREHREAQQSPPALRSAFLSDPLITCAEPTLFFGSRFSVAA
jgi:hypothetical protein